MVKELDVNKQPAEKPITEIKKVTQLSDLKLEFGDEYVREFWGQVFIAAMDMGNNCAGSVSIADSAAKAMTDRTKWDQDEAHVLLEEMYELFKDSRVLNTKDNSKLLERLKLELYEDVDE